LDPSIFPDALSFVGWGMGGRVCQKKKKRIKEEKEGRGRRGLRRPLRTIIK